MEGSWSIDDIARMSLLHDFYGQLLTERQRMVYELYHGENLSLAEIAQELGISRQGVHDALKNGQRALESYEEKLGLVERFVQTEAAVDEIDEKIMEMIDLLRGSSSDSDEDLIRRLRHIKTIIDRLQD